MRYAKKENSIAVINSLVKALGIPVSTFTIENDLKMHPDYPSLLSLSDCLNSWNIQNQAYEIDAFDADEFSYPFIAHNKGSNGGFVLVHEIKNGKVWVSNEEKEYYGIPEERFKRDWDGIVLNIQKNAESGEPEYKKALFNGWRDRLRIPFLIIVLLLTIAFSLSNVSGDSSYFLLLVLKFLGIVVSVILLTYNIDTKNPFIQNLCTLGTKNDCNAILRSKEANITSWLSWSEVGMFYFTGSFAALLLQPVTISWLALVNLFCLPYTFYSIGYQLKIKNWCLLCCTIQALLWLEFLGFGLGNGFNYVINGLAFSSFISFLLCFLIPVAIWSFIKPFFLKAVQHFPLKQQIRKFKYNPELFNQLLAAQSQHLLSDELLPITLGNPKATNVITMVTNPFCSPCGSAHNLINEWLEKRDDLQLKIVFTTTNQDEDTRTKVARHAIALGQLEDSKIVKKALHDWYRQSVKDYHKWTDMYPVEVSPDISLAAEKQKNWCKSANVSVTPTIFINGYQLIEPYQLEDVKYLLS